MPCPRPRRGPRPTPEALVAEIEALGHRLAEARTAIASRIIGQEEVVGLTLAAMLSGWACAFDGAAGAGQDRFWSTRSRPSWGSAANRIQFTPDLMPADILGSEVLETGGDGARSFRFIEGPIFCRLLMADEINRASPPDAVGAFAGRCRSARSRSQANIARCPSRSTFSPPRNPIEQEGTYPLPEAQLDRFLVQIDVPYPDRETERGILVATTGLEQGEARQVFDPDALIAAQRVVRQMPVGEAVGRIHPRSCPRLPPGR